MIFRHLIGLAAAGLFIRQQQHGTWATRLVYVMPMITSSGSFVSFTHTRIFVIFPGTGASRIAWPSTDRTAIRRLGVVKTPSKSGCLPGSTCRDAPSVSSVSPSTSDRHPMAMHDSVDEMRDPCIVSGMSRSFESPTSTSECGGATLVEIVIADDSAGAGARSQDPVVDCSPSTADRVAGVRLVGSELTAADDPERNFLTLSPDWLFRRYGSPSVSRYCLLLIVQQA